MGMILFFLITAPLLVAFVFLLVVQLDNTTQASQWAIVFIPIWFLFLIWAIYICVLIWRSCLPKSEQSRVLIYAGKWTIWFHCFAFITTLAFSVSLCMVLVNSVNGVANTTGVSLSFIPFWIFMVGFLLYSLGCRCCSFDSKNAYWTSKLWGGLLFLLAWLSFLLFTILLLVKISNKSTIVWNTVFIPLWFIFLFCFIAIICAFYNKYNSKLSNGQKEIKAIILLYYVLLLIGLLVFTIFLNVELNNPLTIGVTGLFLPLILVFLILFIMGFSLDYFETTRVRISTVTKNGYNENWINMPLIDDQKKEDV